MKILITVLSGLLTIFTQIRCSQSQAFICPSYPTTLPAPPTPVFPNQYGTIIEANIVEKNLTVTAQEYFDRDGNRAVLTMRQNNTVHDLVFDYSNDQLFYVTGSQCVVRDLRYDDNYMFFGKPNITGVPHVFTSRQALQFSGNETYLGQQMVRGILCDHWQSCLYWKELDSNFTLDYFFTVRNWSDPISYPQIPVRAMARGVSTYTKLNAFNFTHYYDYINFRAGPPDDVSVFETPKGVLCPNRKKTKPVPQLMDFYHYRQEIIIDSDNDVFQADVWYDSEYRFVRFDYRLRNQVSPLYTLNPITEVHDYNYGVRYVKDQVTGKCVSASISNSSFDVSPNNTVYINGNKSYVLHMKNPMQMFYLDNNYAYTGQGMKRGLLCDVFTERRSDFNFGSGASEAIFEYYFLSDGFQVLPDDGSTTPTNVPVYLEITVPNKYHAQYNFLDFDEEHPDISLFDVSSCFSESAKLQFQIRFPGSYKTGSAGSIKRSAQRTLYSVMNVSPLRVQDVRLDYDNSQIYISATLLDRSPYEAQFTYLSNQVIDPNLSLTAQFTYLSNQVIDRNDDKIIGVPDANNITDCARLCVTNPGFTCNSFDFCALDQAHICRLSKAHIGDGGVTLVNSTTCDHFSRTVNGPTPAGQEPSISQAYAILRKTVYNGGVTVQAIIPFELNPPAYVAVDIQVLFGWLAPKQVPSLAGQFSYHLEITIPKLRAVYDSHIYYDSQYKLVRYDMVNTQPTPPLFSVDPITEIHDYNAGLAYTIDNKVGNCSVAPLTNATFDVTFGHTAGYVVKMKSPIDLFYLNGTYRYAGQRTLRGMLCDVFEDHRNDFKFGANPMPQDSIFQFYFLSDNWNELSEDSGHPVHSQPIALVISSSAGGFTLTYNFYDFNEQHPDLSNFDIRSCFPGSQQTHFLIKFRGDYHPTLDNNLKQFTKSVQQYIAFVTQASPLRYQDPQITYTAGYTYYIGTMVEQAPYLLDYTKTSNNVGIYPADKTVDNIMSDFACAALCRKENTFVCESFDYCASAKKCQLSRKHVVSSGPSTKLSQQCDHYSQTVDNNEIIEPTVSEAMIMLKNYVYETGFSVKVNLQSGSSFAYKAVLFDTGILRPDTQATTSVNLQHFIPSRQRVVLMNNDAEFKGVSVDQCASQCLSSVTFDCLSFDYCFETGICLLSHVHPDKNPKLVVTHQMCDLYARKYLDGYNKYPGQVTQTQGDTSISGVSTANYCARMCSNTNQNQTCKSFDYCSNTQMCILKHTHKLDLPTSALQSSSVCSHYSRKYVNDFVVSKGHDLKTGQALQINNVSLDACSKLCVENSGIACKAFSYGTASSICKLLGVDPVKNRANITKSTSDLYTRQYYPGSSSSGSSSSGSSSSGSSSSGSSSSGSSSSGSSSSSSQQQSNNSQGSTGYSPGAMAGLAIGMLIPGLVIGAALLYFCRTKRLVEEEQMRMGFVNMAHDNEDNFSNIKTHNPEDEEPPAHIHQYDTVDTVN